MYVYISYSCGTVSLALILEKIKLYILVKTDEMLKWSKVVT